jgi:hypothetical protein
MKDTKTTVRVQALERAKKLTNMSDTSQTTERETLNTQVQDRVQSDYDVQATVKKVIEAKNVSKGLAIIGGLIDTAVPRPGMAAKLDIQVKIPVYSQGVTVYITLQYVGEAGRETSKHKTSNSGSLEKQVEYVTARNELSFGVGVQLAKAFDINAQFGVYLEGKARNTDKLMQLLSYGAYQRVKSMSPGFAGKLWGEGGTTRSADNSGNVTKNTEEQEAEMWAAMVEEEAMFGKDNQEAFVEAGKLGKAKAVVNVGFGKGEFEGKYAGGTRYNAKKDTGGNFNTLQKRKMNLFELGGKLEFAGESMAGEAKGSIYSQISGLRNERGPLDFGIEAQFSFIAAFGKEFSKGVEILAKYIAASAGPVSRFVSMFFNEAEEDNKKRGAADVAGVGLDGTFVATALSSDANDFAGKLMEAGTGEITDVVTGEGNPLLEMKNAFAVKITLGGARDKATETFSPEFDIELLSIRSMKVDSGAFIGEVEIGTSLARLGTSGVGLLGIDRAF